MKRRAKTNEVRGEEGDSREIKTKLGERVKQDDKHGFT